MGANGTIGVEAVAKSLPDGYTILVTIDTVASNPHVFKTNIDPTKDLVPIIAPVALMSARPEYLRQLARKCAAAADPPSPKGNSSVRRVPATA